MNKCVAIAIFSSVLSAFAQILLKQSSCIKRSSIIKDYLNFYVVFGYIITFVCMILMIIAYRGLPFKYGAVIESLVYIYVMILSRIFFKEKFTAKRVIGNLIIVCGVAVFNI